MRRALLAFVVVLLVPSAAGAVQKEVTVTDNQFVPAGVGIRVGDAVHWWSTGTSNPHNVREDHRLFRSGNPTDGTISLTSVFSAGTYRYYCEVHVGLGMDGLVKVKPLIIPGPHGLPFTVRWASSSTTTGRAFDVQYRVGNGAWTGYLDDTDIVQAVFGKNGKPVKLMDGVRYSFRVRTQRNATSGGSATRWSPAASFTV